MIDRRISPHRKTSEEFYLTDNFESLGQVDRREAEEVVKVSLHTGGGDPHYALGMLGALISEGIIVDFIGNDEMGSAEIVADKRVKFLNLRGDQNPSASRLQKMIRVVRYYVRLLVYVSRTDSRIFHILWFNKFVLFDRTLLNLYYKILGKKLVFTAHNVDEKERDGGNNILNRASLKASYGMMDHVFVHTAKMKDQLIRDFGADQDKITVIPFGINNIVPKSDIGGTEARARLQLGAHEKVLLFFGNIAPYKGLEYAIEAMGRLKQKDDRFRLLIGGRIKGCQEYWESLERTIASLDLDRCITKNIQFIPDEDVEIFFKASDVLVLPYSFIYQSGILFLSYSFGLPVIASDVGSLREDIVEGETGYMCRAEDPQDLARKIEMYFESNLFKRLDENRVKIMKFANDKHSWEKVGQITASVYRDLL
jgi:glycosyltransferase involved in cell wall biosynthesis